MKSSIGHGGEPVSDDRGPRREVVGLESVRHQRVQAVLQLRARCENATASGPGRGPGSRAAEAAQQLLSAAVRDLEDIDERLHEMRIRQLRPHVRQDSVSAYGPGHEALDFELAERETAPSEVA